MLVEDISNRTGISTSFLGIALISWSGNISDAINSSSAAKANKIDLMTTSILSAQIMNLQFCLPFPWMISIIKNHIQKKVGLFIDFGSEDVLKLFLPLIWVVIVSTVIIFCFDRVLNKKSGMCLGVCYISYFIYESIKSKKAK